MIKKIFPSPNPVIIKELRSRMRGTRPFTTITLMLLLLSGIMYGVYRIAINSYGAYLGSPISPQIGQSLFIMLSFLLLLIICLITPAVTAGAISSEHEQLTFEMLVSTPLQPTKILLGKLISSLSYVFLLIFSAIPIASLIFVFGGVTIRQMLKTFVILISVTITLGILGIFLSSLTKRSSRATVLSYILLSLVLFGSMIVYIAVGVFQNNIPPRWIIAINPISALASALSDTTTQYNSILSFIPYLGIDLNTIGGGTVRFDYIPRPLYHFSLPIYGFFSIILYILSVRLVMPTNQWKITRKDLLVYLSAIFLLCAFILALFFSTTQNYEGAKNIINQNTFVSEPAMIEPPVPRVIPVEISSKEIMSGLETNQNFSIEDQSEIYAKAILETTLFFSNNRDIDVTAVYLVRTILDTINNETYSFDIPTPLELSIVNTIKDNYPLIEWVDSIEEGFSKTAEDEAPFAIVINMGDTKFTESNSIDLHITVNMNGNTEIQIKYIFIRKDNEWIIDNQEIIFDAANNN